MYHKIFHYHSVNIKNSYTGKNVKGFKFPSDNKEADEENLQQMQIYFGVNTVITSLQDLMRVGTKKTNNLYKPLYKELIEDYKKQCIAVLSLASSMCWVLTDPLRMPLRDILRSLLLIRRCMKLNLLLKV